MYVIFGELLRPCFAHSYMFLFLHVTCLLFVLVCFRSIIACSIRFLLAANVNCNGLIKLLP